MKFGISLVAFASLAGSVMLVGASTGCGDLTIPNAVDGGGATASSSGGSSGASTGDGGPITAPVGIIPAGAIVGESKPTGFGGDMAAWVTLGPDNKVATISWTLPLATVRTVPGTGADTRLVVNLPKEAVEQTSIRSLAYNFLPTGHIPKGIYDTPHWEFHPAILSDAEMLSINCSDPTPAPPDAFPPGYVSPPADVNPCFTYMGFHAVSGAAPEFNGERFRTAAHLLTFYKGKFTSLEPKATREWLLQQNNITYTNPDVKSLGLSAPTLFPMTVKFEYNAEFDTYVFTYSDFVSKQ